MQGRTHTHRMVVWFVLCTVATLSSISRPAAGQISRRLVSGTTHTPPAGPLLDDAALHDVTFMGERRGWAVGDRGVIWKTDDAGRTWSLRSSGVDCALRAVCFLTDRVGWVVGGGTTPYVGTSFGVVLSTTDGGDTWTPLASQTLPLLHSIQFFNLDDGIAVCESTSRFPSGVVSTADGGRTWNAVAGAGSSHWQVGAFLNEDTGVVAGRLGQLTSVGGGQVLPPLAGAAGLRGIAAAGLLADGTGWLAGDGALVLKTEDGGVSWRPPAGELPRALRDAMDFRAVAARGQHVWLAGRPGSVVWHSADNGATWQSSPTGVTTPVHALHFTSDSVGFAVGALGCILSTTDGGRTWTPTRVAPRRAALLALHAHESRVSLNLMAKYGLEEGYRSVVTLMARRDIGPDGHAGQNLSRRLAEAVTTAGGVDAEVDWAFPVAAPELDQHPQELIREWQMLTDNRLRQVMLARLVVQLRTWRPDVLIVDAAPPDDATTKLLADAIALAVSQAASPTEDAELYKLLALPPWTVKRAFQRLPAGSQGSIELDAFELLPRQGASVEMTAAAAVGRLNSRNVTAGRSESYAVWPLDGLAQESPGRHFFAGLVLSPGGDARRPLTEFDDDQLERRQNLAAQQRNFTAYATRQLDDERHAAQLIGQTKDVIAGTPPEQAAVQLSRLAAEYLDRGQWEYAQLVQFELVERYPDQPVALEALRWLFHFSSSAEVSWQRLRATSTAQQTRVKVSVPVVQADVRNSVAEGHGLSSEPQRSPGTAAGIEQASATSEIRLGTGVTQPAERLAQWQSQAERVLATLEQINPQYHAEPTIQFPLAAFERARKHPQQADAIITRFLDERSGGPWNRVAAGEVWLTQPTTAPPGKVALCRRTREAPYLDGQLDDACWLQALRAPLRSATAHHQAASRTLSSADSRADDPETAFVQLAYDAEFLYLGARLPRVAGVARAAIQQPGRNDDADLSGQDRLSLQFDTDRDYATFYRIDVDQRGWTADACWDNAFWNAQRYIAVDDVGPAWQMEMAIPLRELLAQPPQSGETWGVGLVRVLPTVGIESWTEAGGQTSRPESFGLLRFE